MKEHEEEAVLDFIDVANDLHVIANEAGALSDRDMEIFNEAKQKVLKLIYGDSTDLYI